MTRYIAEVSREGSTYTFASVWNGHDTPEAAVADWRNEHCVGSLAGIITLNEQGQRTGRLQ